jgi:hypothetical protein
MQLKIQKQQTPTKRLISLGLNNNGGRGGIRAQNHHFLALENTIFATIQA